MKCKWKKSGHKITYKHSKSKSSLDNMKFSCATEPIVSELEKDVIKFSCATEPILSELEKDVFLVILKLEDKVFVRVF